MQADSTQSPKKVIGWHSFLRDGKLHRDVLQDDLPEGNMLLRIVYYSDGTRQIQNGDHFIEVDTPEGLLQRTVSEKKLPALFEEYPDAHVIDGVYVADDYWYALLDKALKLKHGD